MTIKVSPEKTIPCLEERKVAICNEGTDVSTDNECQNETSDAYSRLLSNDIEGLEVDSSRAKKIADLKRQIEAGDYQPNLERVAESLLKHIMDDKC